MAKKKEKRNNIKCAEVKAMDRSLSAWNIHNIRWLLYIYDLLILGGSVALYVAHENFPWAQFPIHFAIAAFYLTIAGIVCRVYTLMWRYASIRAFVYLVIGDTCAGIAYLITIQIVCKHTELTYPGLFDIFSLFLTVLMLEMLIRMAYYCFYKSRNREDFFGKMSRLALKVGAGMRPEKDDEEEFLKEENKIKIAIVGAGRIGVTLAEELLMNPRASYTPVCFVDVNSDKIGRTIMDKPVIAEAKLTKRIIDEFKIQEIVFALPQLSDDYKRELFDYYKETGCRLKVYDYPTMEQAGEKGKRHMREFDIEDLLFRKPVSVINDETAKYYEGKIILITGGGGSIGSELCRQIAKMNPKKLIILDVYENGAYDIQQELRLTYGNDFPVQVEILSVCDRKALEKVFRTHGPEIVLHAAAHKHVPLMEHNVCEAVWNNVFGTLNLVELSEQYGVGRFMMVSTDKAVNPTNVMGATKRMCELIVESHSVAEKAKAEAGEKHLIFSATRFGNVLGSAGSVVPLFKRQIAKGGPVTITDKRIVRYFMTIPEASQLVLKSGPMAKGGDLFVLDMGKPVHIIELAENMIRLSGFQPYVDIKIEETGLRPGEKLYEELLVANTDDMVKTDDALIFVEKDKPIDGKELDSRLDILREALATGSNTKVREALHKVVPTFRTPEEVNAEAMKAKEILESK